MDFIFFIGLFIAIAVLSVPFGRDSRDLRDRPWETPWYRMPRRH